MNFELNNALCDLEVLKERIDDVVTSFVWFNDDYFTHEPNHVLNKEDILKEFGELIERFKEIEKTLPDNNSLATKSDNA